ncbi:hypothetical protein PU088_001089 [Citrobacter farmeri]|nr:hypothetical protein [Citrobacter farmeri]
MKPTYEELLQQLENTQREFRSADITMQNLEAKCVALAVENAGLNQFIKDECWMYDMAVEQYRDAVDYVPETPATSAFLAEVRASAIDSIVDIKTKQLEDMHPDTHAFGATAMSIRSQINELQAFAAQLRKERGL